MPTGPECEKRPVLGKRRFKPSHRGSLQRSKAGASKDSPPALTSEGDRGRLLPGFWPWPALTLPRIPDRRSLRIGSETTQADVEVVPDVDRSHGRMRLLATIPLMNGSASGDPVRASRELPP